MTQKETKLFIGWPLALKRVVIGYLPSMPINARDKAGTSRDKQGQGLEKQGQGRDQQGQAGKLSACFCVSLYVPVCP